MCIYMVVTPNMQDFSCGLHLLGDPSPRFRVLQPKVLRASVPMEPIRTRPQGSCYLDLQSVGNNDL